MDWRRNLFAVTAATFIGFTGFTLVMPFLPLYFRQLGVEDVGRAALWSGLSLGVTPALTALLAPLWGRLADRFGRKLMIERSLVSFVFIMTAMAYVREPWHVFALRAVQGLFAGYGTLALTMAADSAPPARLAMAIGTVQTAQRLGPALGPVIGGILAQVVGLRRAFLFSAAFYALGLVLVAALYRETRAEAAGGRGGAAGPGPQLTFRSVLALTNFLLLMVVVFGLQFVDRSFGPILPLYLAGTGVSADRVALVSGVLFSLAAGGGAVGNYFCDRLLRRATVRAVIGGGGAAAAVASLLFVAAPVVPVLVAAAAVFGAGVGVAMTAAYTAAGGVFPPEVRGAGFGFLSSAWLAGLAISPVVNGLLGATSITAVFVLDAVILVLVAVLVKRLMVERGLPKEAPAIVEA